MKIRQGFVSNSSSSSFVVPFPKGTELSKESIKDHLFKNLNTIYYYDHAISVDGAVDVIYRKMKGQTPNDDASIQDALCGFLPGSPNYEDFPAKLSKKNPDRDIDWDAYEIAREKYRTKVIDEFKEKIGSQNYDLYTFEFCDNGSDFEAALEHGGIFDSVEHIRVSKH